MRPSEDAAGQELPSAKLPSWRPSPSKPAAKTGGGLRSSALDQLLAPVVQSRAEQIFAAAPESPVVQTQVQEQQPFLQVTPAPSPLINFNTGPDVASLFQQQQPLAVQVVPQQQQPAVIAGQPVADGGWMDGTFPTSPWVIDEREAAQQVVDQAKTVDRARLRKDYEADDRTETAQELTPKQWASLSPLQQASAQANYDLSQAVKKDFEAAGHKGDDTQVKGYQDRVNELFGGEEALGYKGLDYAPNTIAFLDSRGVQAVNLAGRTLDDFLSGNALMTTETFNSLGEQVKSPDVFHTGPTDARGQNIQFAQQIAKGQLAYQEGLAVKLKQGGQLLSEITSTSTNRDATKSYGALASTAPKVNLTDVRPGTLAQLDKYMQALALPDAPIDQALEAINQDLQERGASPKESAQVWEGMIERSRKAVTGEVPWFAGIDFPMRSPAEVAQALGVPILKRQATQGAE